MCCQISTEILLQEKNNVVVITPLMKMGASRWILDLFPLKPLIVHSVTGEKPERNQEVWLLLSDDVKFTEQKLQAN